ncbi:MAG: hypothetical protein M3154_07190 [Candidatus Eremiobacteraeota bacterium]|nr:hypothetical protein [Candidatus Eremiobacteraeota bacterium]
MRLLLHSDDLLFGSRLEAELGAAGHEVRSTGGAIPTAGDADLIIADLTADAALRIEQLAALQARPPVLAFYSHVEVDVRERALAAGLERVVPRSRMAREAVALVDATAS